MDWGIVSTTPDSATSAPAGVSGARLGFGLCIAVTAMAFESISVATAMPAAAEHLGHVAWYAWAFSAFQIGMLLTTALAGRLCDRLGPVRPMMTGMAIFAVGLVVAGTAPTMVQLIVGRLVQGLGSGLMGVALYVVVARAWPPQGRPRVFSWLSTAWVLPSFLGPPIAAFLTKHLSWHWVFFAVLPLIGVTVVLVLPLLLRLRRDGRDEGHASTNPTPVWAAVTIAAAVPLIQLAGQRLDVWSLPLAAAGIVLLVIGLPRVMPAGLFRRHTSGPRRGNIAAVTAVRGLMCGAYFAAESFIPLMLVDTRHLGLVWAGGVLTVGSVGWTAGAWLQSRTWLRLRRDRIMTAGTSCITAGLVLMALIAFAPGLWVALVVPSWICAGLGMGLAYASTSVSVMALSPDAQQGRNLAALQLAEALGASGLTAIAGTIFAGLHGLGRAHATFGAVIGAMAVIAALAALTTLRIGPVRDDQPVHPDEPVRDGGLDTPAPEGPAPVGDAG